MSSNINTGICADRRVAMLQIDQAQKNRQTYRPSHNVLSVFLSSAKKHDQSDHAHNRQSRQTIGELIQCSGPFHSVRNCRNHSLKNHYPIFTCLDLSLSLLRKRIDQRLDISHHQIRVVVLCTEVMCIT